MTGGWFEALQRNPRRWPDAVRSARGGAQILAVLAEYSRTERMPPAELERQQRELLHAIARHAAAESPHFAGRLKSAGLTPSALAEPGGLARLPPLTRRELIKAGDGLFCRAVPSAHGRVGTTTTSGSTGEPVTVRRTELCQLHWQAFTLREHLWCGRDFSGRLAVARANIVRPDAKPDWGPPCSLVVRTGPAASMPVTRPVVELVSWLLDFQPHYLLIMPGVLAAVVSELERAGRKLEALRDLRTVSETVSPGLREDVRRVLGVTIHDTYSSQECGIMATQCPEAGGYHVSETILLEVVDPAGRPCAPGEVGRLLVTDLLNFATPLVRYEIGDYAEAGAPCSCGRTLPVVRRFLGRARNLVLLPDGSRHWPTVGFHQWGAVFPVRQFQFIQHDRRRITAKMSADHRPTPEQEARLTALIQQALGHPFEIRYEWQVEPLPRGPAGKFEEFRCDAE